MDVDMIAIGARVRTARERAGLSQRDVESSTGISQSMLHRLEAGTRTSITLTELNRLADTVYLPLDELIYGSPVEKRVLAAARTTSCTDEDLKIALNEGIELLKLDDRLDAVVPHLRQAPNRTVELHTQGSLRQRGQTAAKQVRTALGLDIAPIADLVEAIELLTGIDVGTTPLPPGVSGICATDPERATSIVLVNSNDVMERQRFTLAHELGHLLFGDTTHVDRIENHRSAQEILCDEFARHLLIPVDGIRAWLIRTIGTADKKHIDQRAIALTARHFGVSPEVARIQFDRMRLLPSQLKDVELPSGRRCAYQYGWGPQFDNDRLVAHRPRVPRRILDRATEAYRTGNLGIKVLAKLQNCAINEIEQVLADTGIQVKQPKIKRADVTALVNRVK